MGGKMLKESLGCVFFFGLCFLKERLCHVSSIESDNDKKPYFT